MKMSKDDFQYAKELIINALKNSPEYVNYLKENNYSESAVIRVGFYLLRRQDSYFTVRQYDKGLNDRHLETTIKKIINESI